MTTEEKRRQLLPSFISALNCIDVGKGIPIFDDEYLNELLHSYRNGVSRRQIIISYTKWMHDFNIHDASINLKHMQGEVDEANEAWRSESTEAFVKELADVVIYCYGIAQIVGFDLDSVIEDKMKFNIERSYQKED